MSEGRKKEKGDLAKLRIKQEYSIKKKKELSVRETREGKPQE